ncbi:hypothetical protein FIL92_00870 [SAR202 cluster bacterium AD-812-D07_MRT_10900m]|nr:hypothetical protein [SAR202 cluster bacterium AD-812-D07_MRT_10900m]
MHHSIQVPRASPNEDELSVVAVHVEEGDRVIIGQVLFEVESTKSVVTVESPAKGFVRAFDLEIGNTVSTGHVACLITDSIDEPITFQETPEPDLDDPGEFKLTAKAEKKSARKRMGRKLSARSGVGRSDYYSEIDRCCRPAARQTKSNSRAPVWSKTWHGQSSLVVECQQRRRVCRSGCRHRQTKVV